MREYGIETLQSSIHLTGERLLDAYAYVIYGGRLRGRYQVAHFHNTLPEARDIISINSIMIMGDAGETDGLVDSLFTPIEKEAYGRSKIIVPKNVTWELRRPSRSQVRANSRHMRIFWTYGGTRLRLTGDDPILVKEKIHRGGYQL
jgi:hypothetical protein